LIENAFIILDLNYF